MKNKKIWFLFIFLVFFLGAFYLFHKEKNEVPIIDYTNQKEKNIFLPTLKDLTNDGTLDNKIENEATKIMLQVVDYENKPVEGAEIKLYDSFGYAISTLETEKEGTTGVSSLEMDTIYYFEQVSTKDGLSMDESLYKATIDEENKLIFFKLVNPKETMSEEEKEKVIKKYRKKEESKEIILSSKELNQIKKSIDATKGTFYFNKPELEDTDLEIYSFIDEYSDDIVYRKYILRMRGAYILNYTVTPAKGKDAMTQVSSFAKTPDQGMKNVKILNQKKEETSYFQDGEGFYLSDERETFDEIPYKITITFRKGQKTYKIAKTVNLRGKSKVQGYFKIFCTDENGNLTNEKTEVKLYFIDDDTNERKEVVSAFCTSKKGITVKNLMVGNYEVVKIRDNEVKSTKRITVTAGENVDITI